MKTILMLTANPTDTTKLRLDQEVREIKEAIRQASNRDQFKIEIGSAVRVRDLQFLLLEYNPQIVHFSGHGGGEQGLALENELGKMQLVPTNALADLFEVLRDTIECVLLNACYSENQANAIHQSIDCVIGMNDAVGDNAAIDFARSFYRAIANGKSYEDAFKLGRNDLDLHGSSESSKPVIRSRPQVFKHADSNSIFNPLERKLNSTQQNLNYGRDQNIINQPQGDIRIGG